MKIVESWLREWVDPDLDTEALGHRLTMAGHEVDAIQHEGAGLEGVVVAEVVAVAKHPNADRLSVCQVSDGSAAVIEVVCGAPNVVKGMKSPLAKPGVSLPNGIKLRKSKIRGVTSNGMLCSAVELGLGDESDGIIALPTDAPVGEPLADYLQLAGRRHRSRSNAQSRRLFQRFGYCERCLRPDRSGAQGDRYCTGTSDD